MVRTDGVVPQLTTPPPTATTSVAAPKAATYVTNVGQAAALSTGEAFATMNAPPPPSREGRPALSQQPPFSPPLPPRDHVQYSLPVAPIQQLDVADILSQRYGKESDLSQQDESRGSRDDFLRTIQHAMATGFTEKSHVAVLPQQLEQPSIPVGSFFASAVNLSSFVEATTRGGSATDRIILARPVHELFAHIRHLKLPRFALVIRAIKTLVLGIFRRHLCDRVLLDIGIAGDRKIVHGLKGKTTAETEKAVREAFPYMFEKAIILETNTAMDFTQKAFDEIQSTNFLEMTAANIRLCYRANSLFEITPEAALDKKIAISDLFKSTVLKRVQ